MCHRSGRTEFYGCTQVEVMNERFDSLGEQYAVIEAGHGGCPERFVLAYREEKSLRDLIAAASIVALGFASREQAVANIEDCLPAVAARAQVPTATIENRREKCQHRCHPAKRRFGARSALPRLRRWLNRDLQRGVAGPILIFDSRNNASTGSSL